MSEKVKLYLLTGFLGSGKTTFLKNLLENASDKKIGIIQNEFGKVGIDGDIIRKEGMEIVEINRGSIFCSCLKLNFASAMMELAERGVEYLIVESSGLADPSNIQEVLEGISSVKGDIIELKGAICIVDGLNFLQQVDTIETVNRQVKHSNLVVLNKTDLIDQEQLQEIISKIKEINNRVSIKIARFGEIDGDIFHDNLLEAKFLVGEETTNTTENKPKTLTLSYDGEVKKEAMNKFLEAIYDKTYRIKGFFQLNDGWNQIDVVNKKIDYKECEKRDGSQLVIISRVGPNVIKPVFEKWEEFIGEKMKLR